MINVARYGALGLIGGTIAGATIKPKTRNGEHSVNKFSTAAGLGALATTPYLVKNIVSTNPQTAEKIALKTGQAIEKGIEYATKYAKKAAKSKTGKKIIDYITSGSLLNKIKSTKIGKLVVEKVGGIAQKVASNATIQKVATKATEALKKFASSSTAKKGTTGLIAAGVALLAYAGFKTITNYYKKEGAIDQKYDDLHKKYERMVAIEPITNARTGESISFEEFCKLAQTTVK